ncbi:TPA: ead/Ea22-like family protein [Escherichia coli]|nr:ead/Ea22-like family protein [Escherichia coli]HAM5276502.1 ead/Ea22-like family protein [Escherichia coli]HAM5637427.1 ead/Ea22-like family protein [Escherichia coli]HAM7190490.1 ead/Ea22-like family protein [Escherichia coli]HAV9245981.1 ead/Ea22-like family protein [Escherichia coli]
MNEVDYQALRDAATATEKVATPKKLLAFRIKATPSVVLALLDERDRLKDYVNLYEGEKWHYFQLAGSEAERADKAEKELEKAKLRISELEKIATDYTLKFKKAQDALENAVLPHKNAAGGFTIFLPEISEYFIDGVFQPLRYERDIEKAVILAGGAVRWHNKK